MAPAGATRSRSRRLHSLTGVVPVGVFLVFHLGTNAWALRGAEAYNAMARRLQGLPFVVAVEILLIAAPLVFHGIYGLFLISSDEPAYAGRRRLLSRAQRVTGVVLFGFVLFHLWTSRLVQIHDHESLDLFRLMQSALASPWIRALYGAGILSAAFHLSAGLWTFADTWGIATTPRARRAAAAGSAVLFMGLSTLGLATLAAFRL